MAHRKTKTPVADAFEAVGRYFGRPVYGRATAARVANAFELIHLTWGGLTAKQRRALVDLMLGADWFGGEIRKQIARDQRIQRANQRRAEKAEHEEKCRKRKEQFDQEFRDWL